MYEEERILISTTDVNFIQHHLFNPGTEDPRVTQNQSLILAGRQPFFLTTRKMLQDEYFHPYTRF